MKEKGHACSVCTPNYDIKTGDSKLIDRYGIIGLMDYWLKVNKYIKYCNYDIIWFHNPIFITDIPSIRNVSTIHTTYLGYKINNFKPLVYYYLSSIIEKFALNKINLKTNFSVISPQVCGELESIGIIGKKITYIPNGVDTSRFAPNYTNKYDLRSKFGINKNDLVILSLGRLTQQKQPLKMLELFSKIKAKIANATLLISGKGELLEDIKNYIKDHELRDVKLLGYTDHNDLPDLYSCSDYYILTSSYEGQPLSLFEAMSSGLPCIVSDIPNLNIVQEANCGIMVNFKDMDKASNEVIDYLLRDNSAHSLNSREYCLKNLDWNIIADRYIELFKRSQ